MNNQLQQPRRYSNQISIFELLSSLWQDKLKIILVTLVFMITSLTYALNATEVWTVSATIDKPISSQTKQYNLNRVFINEGIRTLNVNTELDTTEQVINISTDKNNENKNEKIPTIKELHQLFISEARMKTNLVTFFKRQPLYQSIVKTEQLDLVAQNNLAYEWAEENVSFTAENQNQINFNDPIGTDISISASTPTDALALSQAYINFINKIMMVRIHEQMNSTLAIAIENRLSYEESNLNDQKVALEEKINTLTHNIQIAKKANIKNFVTQQIPLESAPEYAKGYEILTAEKLVLEQQLENSDSSSITTMSRNSFLIQKWRNFNANMQVNEFNLYRFTDAPKLPITHDKPKRILIVVLGSLLGAMLSMIYLLVMIAIRKHKNKVNSNYN